MGVCICTYVHMYISVWVHVLHVWVYASHVSTFAFCTGFLATRSFRPSNKDFNCFMPCNAENFSSFCSSRDSYNEAESGVLCSSCNGIESNEFCCCMSFHCLAFSLYYNSVTPKCTVVVTGTQRIGLT